MVEDTPSVSELSAELSKDSKAIRELKVKHSSLSSGKALTIRQLREVNSQLSSISGKVSELRAARDVETAKVKELKLKRQQANDAVREIGPEVKGALDAKEDALGTLSKSHTPKKSAGQLYSEMEALEMRIITEAMPFSKEQELMKVIKEKRKQLEAVKAFSEAAKSHRDLFAKFSDLRRQSYASHAELQKHAAESQKFHEEMISAVNKLKDLRERKKSLVAELQKMKADYSEVDTSLKGTLHNLSEVREKLDAASAAKRKEEAEQKEALLTEKLKSGKKLTAKDLIMLQGR
ncbi:hypothetical protein HYU18_01685 [Candidatus Woesearchaeota archaeon]|nr:hypothetical protein [Candidatus Woesearchaeota archaeon]